tara:strand:- start:248 stop:571 length:324 start_codon:yes stop_codon:yes gene_type:complete
MLLAWERAHAPGGAHGPGGAMAGAMEHFSSKYTEVIVDSRSVVANPLAAIDGFFLMPGAGGSNDAVRAAHAEFLRMYQLDRARGPPLVELDLAEERPFSLVSEECCR